MEKIEWGDDRKDGSCVCATAELGKLSLWIEHLLRDRDKRYVWIIDVVGGDGRCHAVGVERTEAQAKQAAELAAMAAHICGPSLWQSGVPPPLASRARFVHEESIRGLQKQLEVETDPKRHQLLRMLIAEEMAKLLSLSNPPRR